MLVQRFHSGRVAALACCVSLVLQGCYSSVATPAATVPVSTPVHLALTPDGAASLVSSLGPRAASLDGRIVDRTDSSLGVLVRRVTRTTGTEEDWPSEEIRVPMSAVRELSTRRLSRGRSIILAGTIAVAAALVGRSIGGTEGGGGRSGPDNPSTGK